MPARADDSIAEVDGLDLAPLVPEVVRRLHVDVRNPLAVQPSDCAPRAPTEHELAEQARSLPELGEGLAVDVVAPEHFPLSVLLEDGMSIEHRVLLQSFEHLVLRGKALPVAVVATRPLHL